MAKKDTKTIGIEYDNCAIRAAKLKVVPREKDVLYFIEKTAEIKGNFLKDEELVAGLKKTRETIGAGMNDQVVSCVSGKQIYTAQLPFRRLPDGEMRSALRYEIRKNLPFEVAGATIEYQFLPGADTKGDAVDVLVASVANILLTRHLKNLEKAGFKPDIIDVFPLAVANTFWEAKRSSSIPGSAIILHIGPESCCLIIDGEASTYYHRTIYFAARELFETGTDSTVPEREKERRITGLTDELARSLSFYESNFQTASFSVAYLFGGYLQKELIEILEAKTGLRTEKINLVKTLNPELKVEDGKFDLAVSLAMRKE